MASPSRQSTAAHEAHHDELAWASPLLDRERRVGLRFAPSACAGHSGTGMGGLPRLVFMAGWWQSQDKHLSKYVVHGVRALGLVCRVHGVRY